ncbi:signal peptidase I [Mesoflavibacter sabulilitoris]|uniref:Signal peptidase I n=1 Tax=Mesoflavibacter zeaxanthinifaciens subsp. sabulilitoris TaxID=1520893 RepID=A0A2T1NPL3_9FLAO|nr:signal peptidase I [Mesoflavibacter zeaxanthinifaciens]MBB3125163.1 signal peptidase I [Mesoflavibacter zeaxanthinifaciens subsp. sabulilitoris]PSG94837.1 signal peptidase I [Mesoflavibacter zeaxanthinifaciens subsp. sabulilitoris]
MSGNQWIIFFFIIQLLHGLATWKLYIKAGRKAWEAFVPVYNAVILMKIINRPWWWTILLFLPIVNLILFPVVWVETARSFNKNSTQDTFLAIVLLGFYNFYLSYGAKDLKYRENRSLHPLTELGDWVSSILFAVVAATIVHTYFIQPFVIPTSSLEKTLLVGDFLFVSKVNYGARTPQTTVAVPMIHDAVPGTTVPSYIKKPQLPYFRLPALEEIERNDIVVFNWPVDTLVDINNPYGEVRYKPVDKKTNYVKRCVGLPGDSLSIKEGYVYINGKKNELPDRAKLQFFYTVILKNNVSQEFLDQYGITEYTRVFQLKKSIFENEKIQQYIKANGINLTVVSDDGDMVAFKGNVSQDMYDKLKINFSDKALNINLTEELATKIKSNPNVVSLKKDLSTQPENDIFPRTPEYSWNKDEFGPIYIPQAGKTVDLNLEVLPLYKRIITAYEGNTVDVKGNQILINGEVANTYTFKQDYYWMMGDNRHNSQDARMWGYVPFDHVVGKPVFVWMSWDSNGKGLDKIRWSRLFTTVGGEGKPTSYFIPFLVVLAGIFAFNKFRKRKKKTA